MSKLFQMVMPEELKRQVFEVAKSKGLSASSFVKMVLTEAVKDKDGKKRAKDG